MPTVPFTTTLDRFEATLPTVPARIFRLQRVLTGAAVGQVSTVVQRVTTSTAGFLDVARVAGKTVTGQARRAGEDVAASARTGLNTVAGQAEAQGQRVSGAATAAATDLLDDAIERVDAADEQPGRGTPYEQWTKSELLARAKELDIDGRSAMDKRALIRALRNA